MTPPRITDLDEVLDLFDGFETSMYRLETLQAYDVEYERGRYEAFLTGEQVDVTPGPWQARIRRHRAAGRTVERVHVVHEPLTDYLRYEMATAYRLGAAAGERIVILPTVPGHWPTDIPPQDYWLFDDHDLWVMKYDDLGQFIAAEHRTEPTEIQDAVEGRRAALAAGIPFDRYLATSQPTLRRVS